MHQPRLGTLEPNPPPPTLVSQNLLPPRHQFNLFTPILGAFPPKSTTKFSQVPPLFRKFFFPPLSRCQSNLFSSTLSVRFHRNPCTNGTNRPWTTALVAYMIDAGGKERMLELNSKNLDLSEKQVSGLCRRWRISELALLVRAAAAERTVTSRFSASVPACDRSTNAPGGQDSHARSTKDPSRFRIDWSLLKLCTSLSFPT
jgi:hypothetical protein